jgi:transposase
MKKRRYSSTPVKSVRSEELRDRVRGRELVVAVDVAKARQYAALGTAEARDGLRTVSFELSETGRFVELVNELEPSHVVAVMEPSGTYGDPLAQAFRDAGWEVRSVSGKKTHDARELYDGVASSHDPKSCHLLLRLHAEGLSQATAPLSSEGRDMRAAVATMQRHQGMLTTLRGQLEGMLAAHWPEVTGLLSLDRPTLYRLLESHPGPEAVATQATTVKDQLRKDGGSFLAESKIEQLVESARDTLGVRMSPGEQAALQALAADLLSVYERWRKSKLKVESYAKVTPGTESVAAMAGKATAVVLASELGDAARYSSAAAYEKACGLNLREVSSGKMKGELHITKRGSSVARQALFFVALRLIKEDEVVKAWYQAKRARDGGVAHKAIVAVMRKLVRALWHVGQGARFDSRKLFDATRLGILPSAEEVVREAREVANV